MTIRTLLYCSLLGLFIWLASLAQSRSALAHADLDRSDPAADALLTTAPTQVQLWFTQELFRRQGQNRIEVYAADGSRQEQGEAAIDDDDRTLLTVALQPDLPPGVYTVRWQAVSSEDGHESAGEFSFTVATGDAAAAPVTDAATPTALPLPADTVTPTPVATSTPAPTAPQPSTTGTGLPCLGGTAPLVLAVGVIWGSRRRARLTR
ncbi:MAG: copper resistance protein CopC [Caldilinea sp. CFX5]|nr:copper resistance protein CopC [Caldilinea sp. CFX5]